MADDICSCFSKSVSLFSASTDGQWKTNLVWTSEAEGVPQLALLGRFRVMEEHAPRPRRKVKSFCIHGARRFSFPSVRPASIDHSAQALVLPSSIVQDTRCPLMSDQSGNPARQSLNPDHSTTHNQLAEHHA